MLYKNSMSVVGTAVPVGLIIVFVDLIINTYWLIIITGKAAQVLIAPRLLKSFTMFSIQTILSYIVWRTVNRLNFISKIYNKC
ncbi:hypothetical protein [Clostridium sp. ZS2-4]|uniref:hypothetical protein n=1 Tax=Clostridium sp. ZS2-4 TaxID=2987703 RepID=UPI00227A7051|nr:hypothetical protein [Clostridium sp. ZS2-4]MCY6356132.1 hypothetical protein [Clostridium sp. ZS2-4]